MDNCKDIISGTFRRQDPTQENSHSFKTLVSTRIWWRMKQKKQTVLLILMLQGWILTCLLDWRPKTAKPGDYGICIVANVWSPGVQTNLEHHDHEALSHERTTTLMRFGSVVAKSADLSRTLETIAMPLGMQLKDPFVHKRGRFQESEMPARDIILLLLYSKL